MLSGDNIDQSAIKSWFTQKTLEKQRYELQQYVKFKFGVKAWDDLLKMEGTIRKKDKNLFTNDNEVKQRIIEQIIFLQAILISSVIGLIFFAIWLKKQREMFLI